jgi:hypothetical protein
MEQGTNTSKFNDAVMQIMRLNACWQNCKHYRTSGNLNAWRWELDYAWSELTPDAIRKKGNNINENEYFTLVKALNKLITMNKNNTGLLYKYLDLKEKFLRKLQDEAGKGSKYEDNEEDAF